MSVLRGRLKAFLFRRSFPLLLPQVLYSACAVTTVIFGHTLIVPFYFYYYFLKMVAEFLADPVNVV